MPPLPSPDGVPRCGVFPHVGRDADLADTMSRMRMSRLTVKGYRSSAEQQISVDFPGRFSVLMAPTL
jgi:hypothetical protein